MCVICLTFYVAMCLPRLTTSNKTISYCYNAIKSWIGWSQNLFLEQIVLTCQSCPVGSWLFNWFLQRHTANSLDWTNSIIFWPFWTNLAIFDLFCSLCIDFYPLLQCQFSNFNDNLEYFESDCGIVFFPKIHPLWYPDPSLTFI